MRQRTLILASLALAATGLGATSAAAQEEYRHGHIRNVEPGVTVQRATEVTAEEAVPNLPFLPGDRVWTDAGGRAEFQFPEGTVIRLDRGSKLDYSDHDESRDERVVLRLWSGSLILRARAPESAVFEIETPGGLVRAAGPGFVRIDVEGGETQLSVYEGEASLDTGRDSVRLAAGQRTWARWGDGPATPEPFDRVAQDDFAQWDGDLESRQAWAANSSRYLPQELEPYAPEFDTHGSWAYEEPVGYVWQPRVATGWAPYTNGRWSWTSFGWTWVPYEPWGWAPHHYGRWGFSVSLGWYWAPGTVWSGGWVNWGVGGGYVGWCALGWNNRPVVPWRHHRGRGSHSRPRGHAVPRGSVGHHDRAWSVVKHGDLGRGDLARRRVDAGRAGALRVADSVHERPDRGARALTRAAAVPRAASARPRPGAASRALRGASPVPMGSTAPRASSARSRGGLSAGSPRSGGIAGASGRAESARARSRAGSVSGQRGAPSTAKRSGSPSWVGSSGASRSRPTARPAPSRSGDRGAVGSLFPSRERSSGSSRPSGVTSRPRSSQPRSGGVTSSPRSSRPRSGGVSSSPRSSRPRSGGVSSSPRSSRPRSGGVTSSPRSSRPRSGGSLGGSTSSRSRSSGAASRSRGGASRSSGVSSRPSSGGSRSSTSRSRSSSSGRSAARSRGGSKKN